jgi:hypothetical protein
VNPEAPSASAQKQLDACKSPSHRALRKIRNFVRVRRPVFFVSFFFPQGSLVLGINSAVAPVLVPEGVLCVSRIEDATDIIPDPVVFFAVCAELFVQLGDGDTGQVG